MSEMEMEMKTEVETREFTDELSDEVLDRAEGFVCYGGTCLGLRLPAYAPAGT